MRVFLILVAMLVWGLVAVLLIAPYGDGFISYASYCLPIPVCGAGWAWYHVAGENRIIGHLVPNVLIGVGSVVILLLITTVSFRNEIAGKELDGAILGLERSSNHQYPVVTISNGGGGLRFEGIADEFFQAAREGDRVEKRAGAVVAMLNGKAIPIVEPSFLDAIRRGTR